MRLTVADQGPGRRREPIGRACSGGSSAAGTIDPTKAAASGLYVSRELCRAMGGDLVLEPTTPGQGAAFSVYLPGEPPDES